MKNNYKSIFTFAIITLFISSCDINKQKVDSSMEELNLPSFDQYFNNLENFSGNVLVAVDGKPIFKKSYGYANIELNVKNNFETKFRIGSVTKQFTAMAIMILHEQGKLNVDDKLSKYISDIPKIWEDITIHQLLTHTSGIMHSWSLKEFRESQSLHTNIQDVIEMFKDQPLIGIPGDTFNYSGTGYFILSSLIEKVSGKTYEDFLKNEIFNKIEMVNSGSDRPKKIIDNRASGYVTDSIKTYNAPYIFMPILTGGGDLYSTLDDFLKWDQSLYNNLLITKESKEKMFKPELNNYAYGWKVIKNDTLYVTEHTGGVPGFASKISRFPNDKLLIVIFSNNRRSKNPEFGNEFVKIVREELKATGYNTVYN